jgi:hypothetical protein
MPLRSFCQEKKDWNDLLTQPPICHKLKFILTQKRYCSELVKLELQSTMMNKSSSAIAITHVEVLKAFASLVRRHYNNNVVTGLVEGRSSESLCCCSPPDLGTLELSMIRWANIYAQTIWSSHSLDCRCFKATPRCARTFEKTALFMLYAVARGEESLSTESCLIDIPAISLYEEASLGDDQNTLKHAPQQTAAPAQKDILASTR